MGKGAIGQGVGLEPNHRLCIDKVYRRLDHLHVRRVSSDFFSTRCSSALLENPPAPKAKQPLTIQVTLTPDVVEL